LDKVASFFSTIFHPAFIPTLVCIGLYYLAPVPLFYAYFPTKALLGVFGIIFIYSALFPIIMVFWLKRSNIIKSIELNEASERPMVFFLSSGFLIALAYFFRSKGGLLGPSASIFWTFALAVLGVGIFSKFLKISAHASAIACALGIYIGIYLKFGELNLQLGIYLFLLMLGLVSSLRLYLGAHNFGQIVLGSVWGVMVGFFGIKFLL
jgi:hypothetical protein